MTPRPFLWWRKPETIRVRRADTHGAPIGPHDYMIEATRCHCMECGGDGRDTERRYMFVRRRWQAIMLGLWLRLTMPGWEISVGGGPPQLPRARVER